MDGGVLAQAPVPLAVGFDVGADLAVRVEEGEAAEPEARVLAGADDAQAPDEALEADGLRVLDADEAVLGAHLLGERLGGEREQAVNVLGKLVEAPEDQADDLARPGVPALGPGSGRAYKDEKLSFVFAPMRAFERRFARCGGD